jgi:uncharacterized oligopeptide transporter (OPT) family protein
MHKTYPQSLGSLLIAAACAILLAFILAKSSPNALAALLSVVATVLLIQVATLRRDLSMLKDQLKNDSKS